MIDFHFLGREAAPQVYAAEQKTINTFEIAALALGKQLGHEKKDFWTKTLPTALFVFLDSWDRNAVREACEAILKMHKFTRDK